MPVNLPSTLPAVKALTAENIFVMTEERARAQDIRPIKILIFNLMPTKITTETQILRLIGNTPLQVEPTFLMTESYVPKHTDWSHLTSFYRVFDDIKSEKFDGMIITGAPVEQMSFEDVAYWDELVAVLEWSRTHVFSTMYICWAAQAALHHFYGIQKYPLKEKMFGIFDHKIQTRNHRLLRGFDDVFRAPHSRHTEIRTEDVEKLAEIEVLAVSDEAGLYLACSRDGREVYITGHSEYDRDTLDAEYRRDIAADLPIAVPHNYYEGNNPENRPVLSWRSHGNLLFSNWLNYHVYQETPFDLSQI